MQKILIIEDEQAMRAGLADLLRSSGYDPIVLTDEDLSLDSVNSATNILNGATSNNLAALIDKIISYQPQLILLDINLGNVNGELLLKTLRTKADLPVIMLTSSSSEMDEVLSMSYGADDFVTKPYNPQILLLRIAAVLKRLENTSGPVYFHDLEIDLARGVIEHKPTTDTSAISSQEKPKRVFLTKNEMIILGHLLSHQGEIVTRDALMTDLWNNHEYINDNALTVNISRVRTKLKSLGLGDAIETRKGLGYILS